MAALTSPVSDEPTRTKRASSRVRKQPEHFTSSPFASSKRKRGDAEADDNNDEADHDAEESSEEDDDPEDDEPAEEEVREKAKRTRMAKSAGPRKPAAKKAKVNGITTLPIRGTGKAPARKRAPKKAKALDSEDAEAAGGLYAELFARDNTADEVASQWIRDFDAKEPDALADVVNFVLKAAGCSGKVTEHDIADPDGATARLTDLQEEHQATEPTDYPMIAKGRTAAAFKSTVAGFIYTLLMTINAKGLLTTNSDLIENIHVWFSTMTSASNRSFRHTSTVCSLSVITALCVIARGFAAKAAESQILANTEGKKKSANKARVKDIEQRAKHANHDLAVVEGLLKDWFDTVFIHRYRDVDHLLRRDCVEALGEWTVTLPDQFFNGNHLRYMGWLLSDEHANVRLEVLNQLRRLYSDSDKIGGLKTFTERFRSRLVEIGTSDADVSVKVAGIELLDLLREGDLLEPDDIDAVGRMIFQDELRVRKAVAGFFSANVNDLYNSKMDDLGGADSLEEVLPEASETNYDTPRHQWLKFKCLAEMLQAYDQEDAPPSQFERSKADGSLMLHAAGVESRFTLAVDALYDKLGELEEWQALAGYLLFDHSRSRSKGVRSDPLSQFKNECTLSEDEEIILLETLNASVKRSLGDLAERVTGTKSKLSKRQKEDLQEEQEESIRNLVEVIPQLLKKFGDVPRTAAAVLRLEGVLALPALRGLRHDSTTSVALLDDLRKQFMSHGTDEVLAPATAAIHHAQSYGELDETALEKVTSLWEDVVSNLRDLLNVATVTFRGASSEEELLAVSNNLLRIVRLATVSNCIAPLEDDSVAETHEATGIQYSGAIDFIIGLIQRAVHSEGPAPDPDEAALEDLVAARAAEAALFYFRWKFSSIMNAIRTGTNAGVAYEMLEALAERRDSFHNNVVQVLDSRRPNDPISVSMASCLLDLFTSAAILRTEKAREDMSDDYTVLIMDLSTEHERAIMKVWEAQEAEFARLSGKRLEKPVEEDVEMDVDADPIDEDPISDDESDDQTQPQTQASQQLRDAKLAKPLIAEERLCQLTTKLIFALIAGVIDDKATRARLERNKAKLGANYKECLKFLDVSGMGKKLAKKQAKTKSKAAGDGAAKKKGAGPKSNAIVAEDEVDDEIEDGNEEDEDVGREEAELDHEGEPEEEVDVVNRGVDGVGSALGD